MSDRVFVDTNVFVYADDRSAREKRARARDVLSELIRSRRAVVSTQILQEYFVIAIKKLGLAPDRARTRVERLSRLDVVIVRPELVLGAIDLHRLHGLSFWDALVVRAAAAAGCPRVLSEDLQDGQLIDGVKIENPFRERARRT
jgi:predicted nucleic acid-binding protein